MTNKKSGGTGSGGGKKSGGYRGKHVKVRTARGRKNSSTRWLSRQLNDPYVAKAQRDGYRSRAAYKLIEIEERFHFMKPGAMIIDLGAAPGSWTQVAFEYVGAKRGRVIGIDLLEVEPIAGAQFLQGDFLEQDDFKKLQEMVGAEKVDIVLSDMAASSTGHKQTDHIKIIALCEAALEFACDILKPGGTFLAKVLQGGGDNELLIELKKNFNKVKHIKPPASRKDSAEMYVFATDFKG
jgi:23S rRNA (uridine2552-2'-O)-methyltransferase